jgi:putative membrane-bound dehydrogenase-like protein
VKETLVPGFNLLSSGRWFDLWKTWLSGFLLACAGLCAGADGEQKELPPAEEAQRRPFGLAAARAAARNMTVAEGLEVTVFAAEPLLRNPSAIDVDERGRVWVCDIANYGSTRKPWGVLDPKGDRIVILEDNDRDGVADKSKVFFQSREIDCPYGATVVGNKVYVSASPTVSVLTDRDGDDKSDTREILFDEIGGLDSDHCVHAFVFGPDGKMYFNFGNHGGQLKRNGNFAMDIDGIPICVTSEATRRPPLTTVYRQGMAFRCNPDGSELEVLAHNFRNPEEICFDSFGTLFQSDNDDDGNNATRIVYSMDYGNFGFTDEMTGAGWREPRSNLETEIPKRHWHQNDPGVVPNLYYSGAGAPCGITVYEGDLILELRGALLHCDAGPREVRAYFLEPDGAGFRARQKVLLATSDTWFRPSDVCVGPDGAIYISDWYDGVVGGHGLDDRVPEKFHGRIYRLAPKGVKPRMPKFDFATARGCVEALKNPNLAARARAWFKLHQLEGAAEKELLKLWQSEQDILRARAVQLLARIPGKAQHYVDDAIADATPEIRMVGLRMARQLNLDTAALVGKLVSDPNPQVRRECAIALRRNKSSEMPKLWAQLAMQHDGKDRWYLEALGIGAVKREAECFDAWLNQVGEKWNAPAGRDVIWRSRAPKAATYLAKIISDPATTREERPRYFRSLDFIPKCPEKDAALLELLSATN